MSSLLGEHGYRDKVVDMIKENLVFLREFLLEFKTTGACFPTSRWAAQALITPLREPNRPPRNILELGPGTGSTLNDWCRWCASGQT